jgi:hypothetical protein
MLSFVPMLSEHKVGEEVTLQIHRDGKYIDVSLVLGKRSDTAQAIPARRPLAAPATRPAPSPATAPTTQR